jgi:hypothetical protein
LLSPTLYNNDDHNNKYDEKYNSSNDASNSASCGVVSVVVVVVTTARSITTGARGSVVVIDVTRIGCAAGASIDSVGGETAIS